MKPKMIILCISLLICFIALSFPAKALLRGFAPDSYPSQKNYGIGIYFAPKDIVLYAAPDLNSDIVEKINWEYARVQVNTSFGSVDYPEEVFLVFYPYNNVAGLAVIDDEENWVKVVYDQKDNLSGWIYLNGPKEENKGPYTYKYYTWLEFMQQVAMKNGIYFIQGVPKKDKKLKGSPDDNANNITCNITQTLRLNLITVKGSWMLIKSIDTLGESPIGWIRWRDDDGQLRIFCNMD